jgi:DMSO/TMAO reductase YedYZ molybdopterin-dependent catalytic subunit
MDCTRRTFMRNVSVGALGLGFGVSVFPGVYQYAEAQTQTQKHDLHMKGTINFKGFIAKEVTPNNEFYITSYSTTVPDISLDKYRLRVEGLVENPYALTFQEIEAMQDKREYVTLECIGNPVGGNAISNALWEGFWVLIRTGSEASRPFMSA